MTYSIKVQDGASSIVDIDITDPEIIKKLAAACKVLNKRLATLRGMAISPIMAVDEDDIEALALDAFTTLANHMVQHGPQQMMVPGATLGTPAAPAAVAPPAVVAPPVAAPTPGVVTLVGAPSPLATVGTAPVGVPSAFTPTAPPAKKGGLLGKLRKP